MAHVTMFATHSDATGYPRTAEDCPCKGLGMRMEEVMTGCVGNTSDSLV